MIKQEYSKLNIKLKYISKSNKKIDMKYESKSNYNSDIE